MTGLPDLAGRPVLQVGRGEFIATYGHLFEHSPWVVERAWLSHPFKDAAGLHRAFLDVLEQADPDERLALVRAHPELADKAAVAAGLTEASSAEQASAGLDRLTEAEYADFHALNRAYRTRFGFPFIICVRLHDKAGILAEMGRRLQRAPETELTEALAQVGSIVRLRLADVKLAG